MASRVNIRFVAFLSIMIVGAVAVVAGVWLYQVRNDASRNVARGDQLRADGDLDRARRYYIRAVKKEPGRRDYLDKLEGTLREMRPKTSDEARELYAHLLGVLRHVPQHYPFDAEAHLRYLEELYRNGRLVNQTETWEVVSAAADDMWNQVPATDPARARARLYRGIAELRLAAVRTDEDMAAAEQDLLVTVEAMPDSDLAWAALASGQLALAEQLRLDGQARRADEKYAQAEGTLRRALDEVPGGVEVARAALVSLLVLRDTGRAEVTDEMVAEAAERLLTLVDEDAPVWVQVETAQVVRAVPALDGRRRGAELIERHVERHPDAHVARVWLARMRYADRQFDEALADAEHVVESEQLPVSSDARLQFELRRQAAGLITDIAHFQWQEAPDGEKAEKVAAIEAACARLHELVGDAAEDPLILRAEGKLAMANGNYRRASTKFEALIDQLGTGDPETLMYAAASLERIGMVGRALEHVRTAAILRPDEPAILFEQARLEYGQGRVDAAAATVTEVLRLDPESASARQLAALIRSGGSPLDVEIDDPVIRAITEAQRTMEEGDIDSARSILVAASVEAPENVQLLTALVRLEMAAGEKDQAMTHLERAIELDPANRRLVGLRATLDLEDPIEAIVGFVQAMATSPEDESVSLAVNLQVAADRYRERARRLDAAGAAEQADAARAVADQAQAAADEALADAVATVPDDPRLIERQFVRALRASDWATAERLATRAAELDLDETDGLLYEGRYRTALGEYDAAVQALTTATDRVPYSGTAWRTLAIAQQRLGNFEEATRAFEQAYRCNPNDPDTIQRYVSVLVQTGEQTRALLILQAARNRFGGNTAIRESWLALEQDVGDPAEVFRTRIALYRAIPQDRRNARRLAGLYAETAPAADLLFDDRGEIVFTPARWAGLSRSERQQILEETRAEWQRRADGILDDMRQREGDTLDLAVLEAQLLEARGAVTDGEGAIRGFIERRAEESRTAAMYIALAEYQAGLSENDAAIESYAAAIDHQDDAVRTGDDAMARFLYGLGRYEEAIGHLERLREVAPSRTTDLRLIESLARAGRFDDAEGLLTEITPEGGPDYFMTMLLATIEQGRADRLFAGGQVEAAERHFEAHRQALGNAQRLSPWNPAPQIVLAQSLLQEFRRTGDLARLDEALLSLDRAEEVRTGNPAVRMVRARVLDDRGDRRAAMGELMRLLEESPDHTPARRRLVQLHIEEGNIESAVRLVQDAMELNPIASAWHESLGDLYAVHLDDAPAAIAAYGRAYELRPTPLRAVKLGRVLLAGPSPDPAAVVAVLGEHPEIAASNPVVMCLDARALSQLGRRDDAIARLREAYDQLPADALERRELIQLWFEALAEVYAKGQEAEAEAFIAEVHGSELDVDLLAQLATVWSRAGAEGTSRALELQRRAIDACPADDTAHRSVLLLGLARLLLLDGDAPGAAEAYAAILEIDPDNVLALNNYAFLLADMLDDPVRALPHARRAGELAGGDASVLDTLGWVEYLAGEYETAEQHLVRSLQLAETLDTHMHLARLYIATDDLDRAQRHLRQAAELRPDPATRAEIDRLGDDIRTRRGSGG
ncbi:MAG: tetratricopeptide repeat protein [Planctomycetota bacterium]|jgi:tetratricopeptide (TPR) repeat protein